MAIFQRIASLKPQTSDTANRVMVTWIGPDEVQREYAVNQRTLNRFNTADELKAALDDWTFKSFGYLMEDIWFHKNRDGTWAIATGKFPPFWPEDMTE